MQLDVINIKGEKTGRSVNLSDEIFGIEPNEHVIYLDVKRYLINQRQGTHKAKERWEIAGSTKKLRKQKGGGGARIGDIKSPVLKGGGRTFGPQPRTYDIKINKQERLIARRSALAQKAKENGIVVLENLSFESPKTRTYADILKALNLDEKRTLLVLSAQNENVFRSARNLPNAEVITAENLNTHCVVKAATVVLVEDAVNTLNETLK